MDGLVVGILVLVFLVTGGYSSNVIIKTGLVKDQGQLQDAENHDVKVVKGQVNFEGEEGYNKNDESKHVNAQDQAKYGEEQANKKEHLDQNDFAKDKFHQTGGGELNNQDSRVAHHKGHHKSGFTNSYHKDESGHNSSFFDDGLDQADEVVHRNAQAEFGDKGQERQNGRHLDQSQYDQNQARHGGYDNSNRYGKDAGQNNNYHRNNYYQNNEDLGRRNMGNRFHGGQQYAEEKYLQRPYHNYPPPLPIPLAAPVHGPLPPPPGYYDNHLRRPPVPPNRITVYEDPRYIDDLRYRRNDDVADYVNLDIRNPAEREKQLFYRQADYYYD